MGTWTYSEAESNLVYEVGMQNSVDVAMDASLPQGTGTMTDDDAVLEKVQNLLQFVESVPQDDGF